MALARPQSAIYSEHKMADETPVVDKPSGLGLKPSGKKDDFDINSVLDSFKSNIKDAETKQIKVLDDQKAERGKIFEKQEQNIGELFKEARRIQGLPAPKSPDLKDVPEAPKGEYRDPMQSMGSLASVIAMFGSLKTRAPLTSALNSAAASMQAFHKGDKERVELERANWHNKLEEGLKQNQIELDKYTLALQSNKFDIEKSRPMFEAIAAENNHQTMLVAAQAGDARAMFDLYDSTKKSHEKLLQTLVTDNARREALKIHHEERVDARAERALARQQAHEDRLLIAGVGGNASSIPAGAEGKTGEALLKALPPDVASVVKDIANGNIDPKNLSTRGGHREKMLGLVGQYTDHKYSDTDYREKVIALGEFQRTKGNAVRFLNVSIDHIDTAAEYSKALKNVDLPKLNQLKNWWQTETGQPAPNTFNGVKDIVASEVIKGSIGGPGGVEERKANAEKVKAAASPEQLDELFTGWKKLMAGQMKGLEKQYESGTRLGNFREKYMLPRARAALEEVSESDGGTTDQPKTRRSIDKSVFDQADAIIGGKQ